MKRLVLMLLLMAATLLPLAGASGSNYTAYGQYYQKADGYWYWNNEGSPYTREKVWYQTYGYYCGCNQYYWTYRWEYKPYVAATYETKVEEVDYKQPGWRGKLLDIAKQRDAIEGRIREGREEQLAFENSIRVLGLSGNFYMQNYGAAYAPSSYLNNAAYGNSIFYGAHGAQANTITGYTNITLADIYGDSNPAALFQMQDQSVKRAQQLAGQAALSQSDSLDRHGTNLARVAEFLAKEQALRTFLREFKTEPRQQIESRTWQWRTESFQAPPPAPAPVMPPAGGGSGRVKYAPEKFMELVAIPSCAKCHSKDSGKVEASLDITKLFTSMTADQKIKIRQRLTAADETVRMPKGGPWVDADTLAIWDAHLFPENVVRSQKKEVKQ